MGPSPAPGCDDRRITKSWFPTCSKCLSRSQAPFCLYTQRTITNRTEGTFERLRYILGGDRPSQTTHLTLFAFRIHGIALEFRQRKGGIPMATPRRLASTLHSLPPILYMRNQNPISGCSKGSRGLSVLPRVAGIFTDATVSLDLRSRQRPNRCTIRAGRNLPDKEFRYLRTVIVTAAVYWGFSSVLLLPPKRKNDTSP